MEFSDGEGRCLGCWVGVEGNGLLPGFRGGGGCHPEKNVLWSGLASRQQGATLALSSQGNWHQILSPIPISHPPMKGCLGPDQDPLPPTSPQEAPKWGNTSPEAGCPPKMLAGAAGPCPWRREGSSPEGSLCAEAAVAPALRG